MYSADEVAKYVINYSIESNTKVSNLKLQKLLYYIQAAFLVEKHQKCFNEPIVAWEFGPVVEDIYREYKIWGRRPIDKKQDLTSVLFLDRNTLKIKSKKLDLIDVHDQCIIKAVIDAYADVENPFVLVKKTHNERPWRSTQINSEIKCDVIRDYYSKNKNKIYNR